MTEGRSSDPVIFSKAIADQTRQRIMSLICCREMCVSDLVDELGDVSQPTVSHHLQILRTAGLVDTRRDGKQIYYTLRQETIADCCRVIVLRFAPEAQTNVPEPSESETSATTSQSGTVAADSKAV
jgi:DNA-binding transcriptional ArsR family regulator